jgi:hypothetical protein
MAVCGRPTHRFDDVSLSHVPSARQVHHGRVVLCRAGDPEGIRLVVNEKLVKIGFHDVTLSILENFHCVD